MNKPNNKENITGELLSEYKEFIDVGTINYLINLICEKEKKSKRQIFKELGISRSTLYQPHVGDKLKEKIIKEAFKRLDPDIVIKILYGHMRDLFINFIIDILSASADEINNDNNIAEFIKEILTENAELLKEVRDIERKKIIEIITNRLSHSQL